MKFPRLAALAALAAVPAVSHAQQWGGSHYGSSHTNWGQQTSIHTQSPLAALAGSIVGGVANGLNASNPQKHAVATGVLGGVSNGLFIASQPTITQQGYHNHHQQGGWQTHGPSYSNRPTYNRPSYGGGFRPNYHTVGRPSYSTRPVGMRYRRN